MLSLLSADTYLYCQTLHSEDCQQDCQQLSVFKSSVTVRLPVLKMGMMPPVWGCWKNSLGICDRQHSHESSSNEYVCCKMITDLASFISHYICVLLFCPLPVLLLTSYFSLTSLLSLKLTSLLFLCFFPLPPLSPF